MSRSKMLSLPWQRTSGWSRAVAVVTLAAGAWALSASMGQAHASDVYWSVGVHQPGVSVGVSNAPPVVVGYPSYPVVVSPPVVVRPVPRVIYGPPPAVVIAPQPRVIGWARLGTASTGKSTTITGVMTVGMTAAGTTGATAGTTTMTAVAAATVGGTDTR